MNYREICVKRKKTPFGCTVNSVFLVELLRSFVLFLTHLLYLLMHEIQMTLTYRQRRQYQHRYRYQYQYQYQYPPIVNGTGIGNIGVVTSLSKALLFGANANKSVTSSTTVLAGSSFTIEAWIYPTGFPNLIDHSIEGLCPLASNYECLYLTVRKSGSNYIPYFGLYGDDCPGNGYITFNE